MLDVTSKKSKSMEGVGLLFYIFSPKAQGPFWCEIDCYTMNMFSSYLKVYITFWNTLIFILLVKMTDFASLNLNSLWYLLFASKRLLRILKWVMRNPAFFSYQHYIDNVYHYLICEVGGEVINTFTPCDIFLMEEVHLPVQTMKLFFLSPAMTKECGMEF